MGSKEAHRAQHWLRRHGLAAGTRLRTTESDTSIALWSKWLGKDFTFLPMRDILDFVMVRTFTNYFHWINNQRIAKAVIQSHINRPGCPAGPVNPVCPVSPTAPGWPPSPMLPAFPFGPSDP